MENPNSSTSHSLSAIPNNPKASYPSSIFRRPYQFQIPESVSDFNTYLDYLSEVEVQLQDLNVQVHDASDRIRKLQERLKPWDVGVYSRPPNMRRSLEELKRNLSRPLCVDLKSFKRQSSLDDIAGISRAKVGDSASVDPYYPFEDLFSDESDRDDSDSTWMKDNRDGNPLCSQLELLLLANNLIDRDITSKSDPMVVVHVINGDGKQKELGRTEVLLDSFSPVWSVKIKVSYQFEVVQRLVFHVYDVDTKDHNVNSKKLKLKDQKFLGAGSCFLSEIVSERSQQLHLNLVNSRDSTKLGRLTVRAEETMASKSIVEIKFCCPQLEKNRYSESVPFLRVSRIFESGRSVPICKTEVADDNLNPTWKPLSLSMQQCGSEDNPLVIEGFNFNRNGNHVLIGKSYSSVAKLKKLYEEKSGVDFSIPNSFSKVSMSQLFVDQFNVKRQLSFLDYISSGYELNLMVAVDFTASNGNPQRPDSLHYIDPYGRRLNSYEQAITEVGKVIQLYDSNRHFPVWGFGGRINGGPVSHCFNLDEVPSGYEVTGVKGIMNAYSFTLQNVSLSGPTKFGPVVNKAAKIAGESQLHNDQKYHVLLIITDDFLTDLQETTEALVRASNLPISILIVGVGGADFTRMKQLSSSPGCRDAVQFVHRSEVHDGHVSAVQSLLQELPGQFLSYMRCRDC